MKKVINVTSNQQEGGITSGEINNNTQPKKQGFWHKPIIKQIFIPLMILIIGGIIIYYITNLI